MRLRTLTYLGVMLLALISYGCAGGYGYYYDQDSYSEPYGYGSYNPSFGVYGSYGPGFGVYDYDYYGYPGRYYHGDWDGHRGWFRGHDNDRGDRFRGHDNDRGDRFRGHDNERGDRFGDHDRSWRGDSDRGHHEGGHGRGKD